MVTVGNQRVRLKGKPALQQTPPHGRGQELEAAMSLAEHIMPAGAGEHQHAQVLRPSIWRREGLQHPGLGQAMAVAIPQYQPIGGIRPQAGSVELPEPARTVRPQASDALVADV
jgi:hypothetical protein